ncbi:SDR family NAD(P)-dependent oxidoreductase [Microbacterium rhizomatis]|uniref:SDR family NAD(P)-dependent oxidoreductase n=1 Tax=Microbacterium rhizomatis TaxID=1631477 RepID=A0A5J5J121_9MICO|nr:SDR family NAD(P)-dependent oxidoreductase [Microbacterium rhizomatis]KAA9108221.1 SDR family NAD(P)-dependent oxidoreductase [Microbacterium rhizomatis]
MTEIDLNGRVAIVTGAARGLGREHALALASRGATVVVNDRDAADAVVEEIRAAGGVATADANDISTLEGATRIVELATSTYGRLDILVNNAGILRDRSFSKLSEEEWTSVLAVHLGGTIWMSKAAWPVMVEQGYGRIVNTTSAAGIFGNFGQVNYGAAKAAIWGATKTLAIEGARHGINVNAIEPGARTRMTENLLGEYADRLDPSLVSPVVVWLSAEACTTTGEVFNVGGGRVARVVIAQTPGYFSRDLSPEGVRDHWDELNSPDEVQVMVSFQQEFEVLAALLTDGAPVTAGS